MQRHPDNADRSSAPCCATRLHLARDGEDLLRRHKKTFLDREPTPSIATVGGRLAELLRNR